MTARLRVAIVMSHADRNMAGAVRDLVFARALSARGADARMFRMHPGRETEREMLLDGAVPASFCPADDPAQIPHRQVSAALVAELSAFAPDIVLFKGMGYAVNGAVLRALSPRPAHGFVVGGAVTDPDLAGATVVFGEYDEQLRRHFRPLREAGAAFIMPKWIDPVLVAPEDPAPAPEHDIVTVGTFAERRKNQIALAPLAARWRIAFVGGGGYAEAVRKALPAGAQASFLGRLPHAEVFAVLRRARLMVHPSTMDGLPRAVVEGMACGLPVVALRRTIYGGVRQGQEGLLVSPEALLPAVETLLLDEELRATMGRRARTNTLRAHGEAAIAAAAERFMGFCAARLTPRAA